MKNLPSTRKRQGVTLVEMLIAVGLVALASTVVMQFTSWMTNAQKITAWKQSAVDEQRLNEIFWQKYFSGATSHIESIITNGSGVITSPVVIATEPVYIRQSGAGDLLTAFPANGSEWPIWTFKTYEKKAGSNEYIESLVTGFLKGKPPYIELYAKVTRADKALSHQRLLSNVLSINSSARYLQDENVRVLTINFVLSHPLYPNIQVRKQSNYKISTTLEPFK